MVVRKFRTTAADGKNYQVLHYNLDVIIALGYRVQSPIMSGDSPLTYGPLTYAAMYDNMKTLLERIVFR